MLILCFCLIYCYHYFSESWGSSLFKFSSGFLMLYLILFSGGNQQSGIGKNTQAVCTTFFLSFTPQSCCITAAVYLLLTACVFPSAAILLGLLETAWKLFKLFLFHFSLCPFLSSSLSLYDIMRCYFDSSASLFSSLLHALQIILSLSVVCVHSICC